MDNSKSLEWRDFPSTTYDQWYQETLKLLKGADFNKRLIKETYDGVKIHPLYHQGSVSEDISRPIRYYQESFKKCQEFFGYDEWSSKEAQQALSRGIDEVVIDNFELLRDLLNRFDIKNQRISFKRGVINNQNMINLKHLIEQKGRSARALNGSLGLDPLGDCFQKGKNCQPEIVELKRIFPFAIDDFSSMTTLMVSGEDYYNAGATDVQEISIVMSKAIFYIKNLLETGLSVENIFRQTGVTLALSPEIFSSVTKLRAFRLNWQQVYESFGGKGVVPLWLHGKIAKRCLTQFDPWVNILRGTVVCWSGAVGGADALTVSPFDERIKNADGLSLRVARNTGLILDEESHLSFVEDPLAGSYAVETLTNEMAERSWELMQKIEEEGGIVNYVESGKLKNDIEKVDSQRTKNIRKRKDSITGVSEYPLLVEELSSLATTPTSSGNFPIRYNSEHFENLRRKSLDYQKIKGVKPTVAIVTLGPVAKHIARSTFTQNFFWSGGIDAIQIEGEKSKDEINHFLKEYKTSVVCLSAPDELYLEKGMELVKKLREAGASYIVLAGKITDELKTLEVNTSLSLGCDVLDVLQQVWSQF